MNSKQTTGLEKRLFKKQRKTKLIWSLDGSDSDFSKIDSLRDYDWDGIRFVYNADYRDKIADCIKSLHKSPVHDYSTAIILDLAGHVRAHVVADFKDKELVYDDKIKITATPEPGAIPINSKHPFTSLFKDGCTIYLSYGDVVLKATSITEKAVDCRVIQGGKVRPNMDLHIPDTRDYLQASDVLETDVSVFLENGCNYLIVPGWLNTEEISNYRKKLAKEHQHPPRLLLKLDSMRVKESLITLIEQVDGVFISRKELSLTSSPAMVPVLTKEIIQICANKAKIVITASDMLASMRYKPSPTRAEVSDIANAVFDGADAVVLSEDLCKSDYHQKAVKLMNNIIVDAENSEGALNWVKERPPILTEYDAVSFAAFQTAKRVGAKAFVCITESGNTPLSLASFRPEIPIIAVTFNPAVAESLATIRGVDSLTLSKNLAIDDVLPHVNDLLKGSSWLEAGDSIIFVSVTISSLGKQNSNLFTIQRIE